MVSKKTGTYADCTAACGLGVLLRVLTGQSPVIRDAGSHYAVELSRPVELDQLDYGRLQSTPGYKYVKTSETESLPQGADFFDLPAEAKKVAAWQAHQKARKAKAKVPQATEGGEAALEVDPEYPLYRQLGLLQALGSHNALFAAIRTADRNALAESVRLKLEAMAMGRDPAREQTPFEFKARPVQGFNPVVGKGVNRLKPDKALVENLDEKYADWFEEWLRYAGTPVVATARAIGKEKKDVKFLALAPANIRLAAVREVLRPAFVSVSGRVWSSSQLDVQGCLEVAKCLVQRSGLLGGDSEWTLAGYTPRDLVSGLYTTYFKSLGQGKAVTNLSFIGLPGWFPVTDPESARAWVDILEEHISVVGELREDRSEEYSLIVSYRDFLSGHDLKRFLEFAAGYASFVQSSRARRDKRPVRQMTVGNIRKLVVSMEKVYAPILDNAGFRGIARAVRLSTVTEQYHASKQDQQYEIRYSLFHDLRRAARFKERLLQAVADFVASYNAENARVQERLGDRKDPRVRLRPRVTTEELEQFVRLVDEYNCETVGFLLIAYGSAREPQESPGAEARE